MNKNILMLILSANSLLLAMEEQKLSVKVPGSAKRNNSARKVLEHAGYADSEAHLKALLFAFEKMERAPVLVPIRKIEADVLAEEGEVPQNGLTRFDNVKHRWNSYYCLKKSSKTKKSNGAESIAGDNLMSNAQELSKIALEYFIDSKESELTSQKKQKYIIAFVGAIATIVGPILTTYFESWCHQQSE